MAKEKKKVPQSATARENKKQVRASPPSLPQTPSWRFSTVDRGGPFAWPKGQQEEAVILDKLHEFDSMTWDEIKGKQHHAIDISSLSKEARARLAEIKQDDISEIFSFRLQGEPRVFGIRIQNVVKLLWWDPKHQVCPSTLKNT